MKEFENVRGHEANRPILFESFGIPVGATESVDIAQRAQHLALDLMVHHGTTDEVADVLAKHQERSGELFGAVLVAAVNVMAIEFVKPALAVWERQSRGIGRAFAEELKKFERD